MASMAPSLSSLVCGHWRFLVVGVLVAAKTWKSAQPSDLIVIGRKRGRSSEMENISDGVAQNSASWLVSIARADCTRNWPTRSGCNNPDGEVSCNLLLVCLQIWSLCIWPCTVDEIILPYRNVSYVYRNIGAAKPSGYTRGPVLDVSALEILVWLRNCHNKMHL